MSTETPTDLPWPHGSEADDDLDYERLPYAIRQALLDTPPERRNRLLERIGDMPTVTTVSRVHGDGQRLGVVLDGEEVAVIDVDAIRGIDLGKVRHYAVLALSHVPEDQRAEVRDKLLAEDSVTVIAAPDDDYVRVHVDGYRLAAIHRARVIHGAPDDD